MFLSIVAGTVIEIWEGRMTSGGTVGSAVVSVDESLMVEVVAGSERSS